VRGLGGGVRVRGLGGGVRVRGLEDGGVRERGLGWRRPGARPGGRRRQGARRGLRRPAATSESGILGEQVRAVSELRGVDSGILTRRQGAAPSGSRCARRLECAVWIAASCREVRERRPRGAGAGGV
jgi:hypothetical protein